MMARIDESLRPILEAELRYGSTWSLVCTLVEFWLMGWGWGRHDGVEESR